MVLTEQIKQDEYPAATMETAQAATENTFYSNLEATRVNRPSGYTDTYTNPNDKVALVRGDGNKIGPAILLKVMAGDRFNVKASAWWTGSSSGSNTSPLTSIVSALISSAPGVSGGKIGIADLTSTLLDPQVSLFLTNDQPAVSGKPKAYLNWILFDEQFKYVDNGNSGAEAVEASGVVKPFNKTDMPVDRNGYLYIYTSNETSYDVFFDNLQVTHIRGPLLEETHYYPFGLTMAGISSKALSFGGIENKYKFNGGTELANKEFSDGSGLELYETPFRMYDPQIGRFFQIDGMADDYEMWTPYAFGLNNPIFFNDPSGLEPDDPPKEKSTAENPTELAPVVVKGNYRNKWNYTDWTIFVDKNKNHDLGDLAKYLRNKGVDEKGMKLFNQAWSGIGYRERLAEIEAGWRDFVKDALLEGAMWVGGGLAMKVGGKLIALGYREYKVYRKFRSAIKAIEAGEYTTTKTVANNLLTRPYINSPSTITNIMKSGRGAADAFFEGGMNYKVPGFFNGSNGVFELGINPETRTVYHFLFKTAK
jgi:RHS repeat-associated protein